MKAADQPDKVVPLSDSTQNSSQENSEGNLAAAVKVLRVKEADKEHKEVYDVFFLTVLQVLREFDQPHARSFLDHVYKAQSNLRPKKSTTSTTGLTEKDSFVRSLTKDREVLLNQISSLELAIRSKMMTLEKELVSAQTDRDAKLEQLDSLMQNRDQILVKKLKVSEDGKS